MASNEMINAEVLTLTYGALVRQLVADLDDVDAVNRQLDAMGFNIGARLVDDYLARTRTPRCPDLRTAADAIARVAFKQYLGAAASVSPPAPGAGPGAPVSLLLDDTPLTDFVELPPSLSNLSYLALLAGAVRGGLDAVGIAVDAAIVRDSLRGDAVTEIRLTPKGPPAPEAYPFKDDD